MTFFAAMQNKTTGNTTENNFSKASLLPGENVIASAQWNYGVILFLSGIIGLIFWILFFVYVSDGWPWEEVIAWSTFFPIAFICTILLIAILIAKRHSEFTITNKRIIVKYGIFIKIAFELKVEKLESVIIYQGLFGRLFDYGAIQLCGTGASKVRVGFIKNPFEFRQHFFNLLYTEKQSPLN